MMPYIWCIVACDVHGSVIQIAWIYVKHQGDYAVASLCGSESVVVCAGSSKESRLACFGQSVAHRVTLADECLNSVVLDGQHKYGSDIGAVVAVVRLEVHHIGVRVVDVVSVEPSVRSLALTDDNCIFEEVSLVQP